MRLYYRCRYCLLREFTANRGPFCGVLCSRGQGVNRRCEPRCAERQSGELGAEELFFTASPLQRVASAAVVHCTVRAETS